MVFIDPVEQQAWDNRRSRARSTFETTAAQNEFRRGNILQNQGLDTASLARRFDRMREQLPGGYARRGLLNSGIYKQGLTRYAQDRQSAQSDLFARYQQMLGDLAHQQQLQSVNFMNTIGDINDQERVRRAQIAAALQGIS